MNSSICGLSASPSQTLSACQLLRLAIVAWVLPLLLLLSSASIKADQFGDFTYTSSGTAITITGYTGAGGAVTIPGTILSLPVTTIGYWAFGSKTAITNVSIPAGVTSIENSAFSGCTSLTSMTIPNGTTSIGDYAFSNCGLTSVAIPTSVTSIGSSLFYGSSVFYGCTGLISIAVDPANTAYSSLDGVLFDKAKTVLIQYPGGKAGICSIPASVTFVLYSAFRKCIGLTSIIVDPANAYYSSLDGVLFDKTKTTVIQFPGAKTGAYSVPSSVTSIGRAFSECTGLTSVIIPSGVTNIESSAFSGCTSLTSVTIPSSVTSIGSAFSYCNSLTSVIIPSGVTRIVSETFRNCTSLTSVIIPSSVTSIGSYAFYYCTSLSSVTIPSSVTSIEYLAFSNCTSLTSATIPNSVTSIGSAAFDSCTSLTSVIIPSSVTSIGHSAFSRCASLTSVDIPASITSIENGTFSSCTSLTSVTIPASVTSISDNAFRGTGLSNSLVSVIFLGNAPTMGSNVFANAASGFKVYFVSGATGFTTPAWMGYQSESLPPNAEIVLEEPAGTGLADGGTRDFGTVGLGGTASKVFTILNMGSSALSGLAITKDGAHASDFTASTLGATTLATGASTTFTVTFAPGASGTRSAAIHIASNDADENRFVIQVIGNEPDPFAGSHSPSLFTSHDNIRNFTGVLDHTPVGAFEVVKNDSSHYTVSFQPMTNLLRSGNRLQNTVRPLPNLSGNPLDLIMLSDGVNKAYVQVTQESYDPDDISFGVASWTSHVGNVTAADWAGTWDFELYSDSNLRNTSDGFDHEFLSIQIQQVDANHIQIILPSGGALPILVSGNTASLETSPLVVGTIRYHEFRLQGDGQRLSVHSVASEIGDLTDVSVTIGLGIKQAVVSPPLQAFNTWTANAGLTGNNALPTATPFQDGVSNLLKYAFHMNVGGPDVSKLTPGTGNSGLPYIARATNGSATTLHFEYLRRKSSGLIYTPRISPDLTNWTPLGATPVVTSVDAEWERVVIEEPYDPVTQPHAFGRVEVALP